MYISDALKSRNNNFDHIRLLAAITVIVSHSFPIVGLSEPSAPFYNNSFGGIAVAVFLMISGFLVTGSWDRSNNPFIYFRSRCLRIFPALIVMILLTVFVLGPAVTSLPIGSYFKSGGTYRYLASFSLIYMKFELPGVFLNNPLKAAVNGSIWTLRYEFAFYVALALFGIIGLLKKRAFSLSVFAIFLTLTAINTNSRLVHPIFLFCYFMAGAVFYLYRDLIPLNGELAAVCLLIFILSSFIKPLDTPLFVLFGSYLLFYAALTPRLRLPQLTRFGDYSYGLYIYAFPIQQTIAWFYKGKIGYFKELVLSLVITGIFAFLSWHLIEKRMLKLKKRPLPHIFQNESLPVFRREKVK